MTLLLTSIGLLWLVSFIFAVWAIYCDSVRIIDDQPQDTPPTPPSHD
jgi:hypothetical protein